MSQDIVADALNQMMNARRMGLTQVTLKHHSTFLLALLALAKLHQYVADYRVEGKTLIVSLGKRLNACRAIKPRYVARVQDISKYVARYLPAPHLGMVVLSTSRGLMTQAAAQEQHTGGSIIAYFY